MFSEIILAKNLGKSEIKNLENLVKEYPYFSTAQLMLAKAFYDTENENYEDQIKKTAIYVRDRKKLFEFIIKNRSTEKNKGNELIKNTNKKKHKRRKDSERSSSSFKKKKYSFSEWIAISKLDNLEKKDKSSELIDQFIKKQPRIKLKPQGDDSLNDIVARKSVEKNDEIVTLTLAKVYTKQGHYEKAISAYKELSLKYPKKNSFFAAQIKLIKNLKNK